MTSCEWAKIRPTNLKSPYSTFYYEKEITTEKILRAVIEDKLFGILNVTLKASDDCKKAWSKINWPPLFRRQTVSLTQLKPEMRKYYEEYGTKPRQELSQGFSGQEMSLSSDIIRFLMKTGFIIEKVHWVLEYQKSKCMKKFIERVTAQRQEATNMGKQELATCFKSGFGISSGPAQNF